MELILNKNKTIELTQERLEALLCGALEGGSNYWYLLDKVDRKHFEKGMPLVDNLAKSFHIDKDYELKVYDIESPEDDLDFLGLVTRESILEALYTMQNAYPTKFANIMNEEEDAEDCDIWFQLAVMNDVVYG